MNVVPKMSSMLVRDWMYQRPSRSKSPGTSIAMARRFVRASASRYATTSPVAPQTAEGKRQPHALSPQTRTPAVMHQSAAGGWFQVWPTPFGGFVYQTKASVFHFAYCEAV